MATVLVTGAAGFIGSHTTDQLLAAGHRVIGADNFHSGRRENLRSALDRPNFEFLEADVAEPGVIAGLAAEFSPAAVVHLAGLVSVQESIADPALNDRLNFSATRLLAEAAAQCRIPRIVFASSAAVYGNGGEVRLRENIAACRPLSPYGVAKLASEELLLKVASSSGGIVRCHRYFNVFGPRQDPASPYSGVISVFARCFREGRAPTVFGDGRQTRDFISVHDVARANLVAATRPGIASGIANICTGQATSLRRLLETFAAQYPGAPVPIYAPGRSGDIRWSVGDASTARDELDFTAQWTVAAGLKELIPDPSK